MEQEIPEQGSDKLPNEGSGDPELNHVIRRWVRGTSPLLVIAFSVILIAVNFSPMLTSLLLATSSARDEVSAVFFLHLLLFGWAVFMLVRPVWVAHIMLRLIARDRLRVEAKTGTTWNGEEGDQDT